MLVHCIIGYLLFISIDCYTHSIRVNRSVNLVASLIITELKKTNSASVAFCARSYSMERLLSSMASRKVVAFLRNCDDTGIESHSRSEGRPLLQTQSTDINCIRCRNKTYTHSTAALIMTNSSPALETAQQKSSSRSRVEDAQQMLSNT